MERTAPLSMLAALKLRLREQGQEQLHPYSIGKPEGQTGMLRRQNSKALAMRYLQIVNLLFCSPKDYEDPL